MSFLVADAFEPTVASVIAVFLNEFGELLWLGYSLQPVLITSVCFLELLAT